MAMSQARLRKKWSQSSLRLPGTGSRRGRCTVVDMKKPIPASTSESQNRSSKLPVAW